jgi:hypothetical protein
MRRQAHLRRRLIAAGLLAAGLQGGCAHPAGRPAPAATAGPAFNGTDLAWIEVNIAMREQLLPLLTFVREKGDTALTARVRPVAEAELATLRALHDRAGLPAQNPHEGMPMPGMVTPEDLAHLRTLSGVALDKAVTAEVHEYLEQGRNLARSETAAGAEPQTRRLAADILRSSTALL